jgi:hypothetical protein
MPLLHRSEFRPLPVPAGLSPEDRVFFHPDTGEVFQSYADYLEHYWLYTSRIWSCSTTGKGGLTFREALWSEQAAAERLEQRFRSSLYLEPLCRLVHHFPGRLDELVDAIALIFQKAYVPGEIYVDGGGEQAPVRRAFVPRADSEELEPLRWSPDLARAVLEKRFEFARLRYELEDGRLLPAPLAVLNRKAPPVSKTLLKQKIREVSTRDPWHGAPLVIQNPELMQRYELPEALPTPEMQRAKFEYEERRRRLEEPPEENTKVPETAEKSSVEQDGVAVETNKKQRPGKRIEPELLDDQAVDHAADPPRPEPEYDFIVDRVSFGDVLMIWNFLNQFGKQVLLLSSFSLDDFEGALAYPPGHSPLIDAVFDALLRLLLTVSSDPACSRDLRDFMVSSSKSGTLGMLRRTLSPSTWPQVLVEMIRNMKLPPRARRLFTEHRQRLASSQSGMSTGAVKSPETSTAMNEQYQPNGPSNHFSGPNDENEFADIDDGDGEYSIEEQIFLWGEPRSPLVSSRVIEAVLMILYQGYGSVPLSGRLAILCALCEEAMATERVRRVLDSILVERAEVARATRVELLERRRMLKEQIQEAEEALVAFEAAHGIGHERTEDRAVTQSEAQTTSLSTTEQRMESAQQRGFRAVSKHNRAENGSGPRKDEACDHSEEEEVFQEDEYQSEQHQEDDETVDEVQDDPDQDYDEEDEDNMDEDTGDDRESRGPTDELSSGRTEGSFWGRTSRAVVRRGLRAGDSTSRHTSSGDRGDAPYSTGADPNELTGVTANGEDTNGFVATPDMKRMVRLSRREALAAEQERRALERKQLETEREHARLLGRKRALLKELRKERETYGEQMQTALAEYTVRTNPLGLDRDLNRFWFFHGEGRLFIEQQPNADEPPVWSFYSTKAQLDAFLLHLNERGRREHMLNRRILRSYNWIVSAMRKRNQTLPAKRVWANERPSRTRQTPESRLSWFRYENKLATEPISRPH